MKKIFVTTAMSLAAAANAFGQSATVSQSSTTSASTSSGATAIGGGESASNINSVIGGSRSVARGGQGGHGGNAAGGNSAVSVYVGSGDPNGSGSTASPVANAQQVPTDPTQRSDIKERITTTGNPGAMSFGVSFSQFNCANTAGAGVGFMGGVVQLGGGLESGPCNARANASALFSIAQTLATSNPTLSSQLFHAAVLLIGNSTKDTKDALTAAGVSDWAETPGTGTNPTVPIIPPAAPQPEGKVTPVPTPSVAAAPLPPQVIQAPEKPVVTTLPSAMPMATPDKVTLPVPITLPPAAPAVAATQDVPESQPIDHEITADEVKAIMYSTGSSDTNNAPAAVAAMQ